VIEMSLEPDRQRPDTGAVAPVMPSLMRWIGLCAAAETVGMAAAAAAAKAASVAAVGIGGALALVVAGGLVEGLALGVAQARGLRRVLASPDRRRWVLVTATVAGLGWAAAAAPSVLATGDGEEPPLALVLAGAAALGATMGAVLGAVQAAVLRGRATHPWRWVGANVAAWAAAMTVIFIGATIPGAGWSVIAVAAVGAVTGALAGAVLGALSGWFLPSLTGTSPSGRIVLAVLRSPAHRLLDPALVGLRFRGARSGRRIELPVQFAADPEGIIVVPGRPEAKRWWRNLHGRPPVDVLAGGRWHRARAELLRPGDAGHSDALAAFGRRWPKARIPDTNPVVRLHPTADDPPLSSRGDHPARERPRRPATR
jgi:MFS family permease